LEEALRVVRQGEVWVSQQASSQLVKKLVHRGGQKENEIEELTRREWETLALVAAGNRNKEIANRLCVSENTVKAHLYAIYRKLHVSTRMGAALFFFQYSSQPGGITKPMHTNDPAEKSVCKGDRPRRKLLTGR
jgi:DNA-binding NarL/FixJ family response regulator